MIKAVDASGNESAGLFSSATPVAAITIGGLGSYGTVQAAINAAVSGEAVTLGPGSYSGPLTLRPGVSIIGYSSGYTFITGTTGSPVIVVQGTFPSDPTSTIGYLAITTGTVGVSGGTADLLLDHLIIHHMTSHGATSVAGGRLLAVNCTIMNNGGDGIQAFGTASARNCIVGRNGGIGLNVPAGAPVTYNDAYLNLAGDYAVVVGSGAGNLSTAAIFVNESANDYIEDSASPSVDAGDPANPYSQELAPNGGRINQGAFGNTRWATSAAPAAPPSVVANGGSGKNGCGATGMEFLIPLALILVLRRLRRKA
jgi:hypothetical protein